MRTYVAAITKIRGLNVNTAKQDERRSGRDRRSEILVTHSHERTKVHSGTESFQQTLRKALSHSQLTGVAPIYSICRRNPGISG